MKPVDYERMFASVLPFFHSRSSFRSIFISFSDETHASFAMQSWYLQAKDEHFIFKRIFFNFINCIHGNNAGVLHGNGHRWVFCSWLWSLYKSRQIPKFTWKLGHYGLRLKTLWFAIRLENLHIQHHCQMAALQRSILGNKFWKLLKFCKFIVNSQAISGNWSKFAKIFQRFP